jgi:deoxyribonucleoside regulator
MPWIDNRLELLAEVATLYYEDGLTQEEIAGRLSISRSNISRLLTEARVNGVVEIHVNYPWQTSAALQTQFMKRFDLSAVRILKNERGDYQQMLRGLGALAARYLERMIVDRSTLAIGWGTAVHEVVNALRPAKRSDVDVVQMIGALGSGNQLIDGPELARVLANRLGGRFHYLHAPLIVGSAEMQRALVNEARIHKTLEMARRAALAVVGIGSVEPSMSSLVRAGYLTKQELAGIRKSGAVGDICARQFSLRGDILDIELNQRVVGIDCAALKSIGCVIGVAGGLLKAPAILGALRGGFVDVLVTDAQAAEQVLHLDKKHPL